MEDEALDILWSMIMEEGDGRAMRNLDTERVKLMVMSHSAFGAMIDYGEIPMASNTIDARMLSNKSNEENAIIGEEKREISMCIKRALNAEGNWEKVQVEVTPVRSSQARRGDDSKKFLVLVKLE